MKASHRKDVIIARLIFAAMCLFLIAIIAVIVINVTSKNGKKSEQGNVKQNAVSESVKESENDTEFESAYLPQQTTENTEKNYVTTTSSINMREQADKNAKIITVIGPDVKLEFVSEDNGWTQVVFQGQTGYVCSDYVKSDMTDAAADTNTTDSNTADGGAADQGAADGSAAGSADSGTADGAAQQ
ncbi:MAG: SH3 domain-containing protein [Agathobacter sp.]|uniref:SH3 domain-containing protein n=1 Tax=Agathobacter sp. TaxID=2021311 RepID=UPI002E7A0548|nr:SH3 domain-containing protein [Agathobacter sp.]MEE1216781.1 SH3 domain-containing protein [Agathobacter sp.]